MAGQGDLGVELESRVLRLFLAQGIFAERGLFPAATRDRRMLATDIDILVSEYGSGFHLTRHHAECKTGKIPMLDRVLWLNGVRNLIDADGSYLVGTDLDLDACEFARSINIQLMTIKQLSDWENALAIPADSWPCRSAFGTYEGLKSYTREKLRTLHEMELWRVVKEAVVLVEVDGWLNFRYGLLNRLLRLAEDLAQAYPTAKLDAQGDLCVRYVASAMLVRFCQYLLAICLDLNLAGVLPMDVGGYLHQRLIFGDKAAERPLDLIDGTLSWVKRRMEGKDVKFAEELDARRFATPPPYATEFVHLVERVGQQSDQARFLPIAMEVGQFGREVDLKAFPRLASATTSGERLAGLVRGFWIRALSMPKTIIDPVGDQVSLFAGRGSAEPAKRAKHIRR